MKITIGDRIKVLRSNKGMTQEQLAGFLCVSFQTVSKWERDETLPDVALLPKLADFFDVTVDELLGYSKEKNERLVSECIDGYKRLVNQGRFDEAKALLVNARRDYPADFRVMTYYMLVSDDTTEIDGIYKRICGFCLDDEIRAKAKEHYCGAWIKFGGGAPEEVIEAARHFKHNYARDFLYPNLISGGDEIPVLREMLHSYCMAVSGCAKMLCSAQNALGARDKIEILSRAAAVYEVVYEAGDMFEYNGMYVSLYELMGRLYLELGEKGEAVWCFEKCAVAAIAYDTAKTGDMRSSVLFRGEIYDKGGVSDFSGSQKTRDLSLRAIYAQIFTDGAFDPLREDERFHAILRRLTPCN